MLIETQIHADDEEGGGVGCRVRCDCEIVTDMWQGGTNRSLDELVASPRSMCQGLAASLCQAWVAS